MKCRAVSVLFALLLVIATPARASAAPGLSAPRITSAVATSATSIDVAWTPVERAVGYTVRFSAYGEVDYLTTTATSATLRVFAATPYTIEVQATGRNGVSPWSQPVRVTTPPAPPTSVSATAVRPDTVLLTWATGYGEASYEVFSVAADGTLEGPLEVTRYWGWGPNQVLVSSTPETTTSYVVKSVAYDGQRSAPSETVTVTTPPRWPSELWIPVYGAFDEGSVTLSAVVVSQPGDRYGTIGGEMTFTIGGGEPQTVPVMGGSAQITTELAAGYYYVSVSWTGDTAYLPSSTSVRIEVRPVLAMGAPELLPGTENVSSAATGDVTGDGRPDLVTVHYGETANQVQVRAGQADGSLAAPSTRQLPSFSERVALGDLNGDGQADAAITSPDGVLVLAGSADGLGAPSLRRTGAPRDVKIADLNGDRLPDIVVSTSAGLQLLPGTGRLLQGKAQTIVPGSVGAFHIGDLAGDARPDVAGVEYTANGGSDVVVWTLTGTGSGVAYREPVIGFYGLAVGDVSGDGRDDLAWSAAGNGWDQTTQLRLGGTFQYIPVPYAAWHQLVATGDMDRDGRDNLIAGPQSWSSAPVWRVTGNQISPSTAIDLGGVYFATGLLASDVTGDGLDDLLVLDQWRGVVLVRHA